jgi:hypothetical protein
MLAKMLQARLDKVWRASLHLEKRIFGKREALGVASMREMLVKSARNVCQSMV